MNTKRLAVGFGWGVVATIAMSILMIAATASGLSPMPKPIPAAIVGKILGAGSPKPLIMILTIISHLGYGGFWGAVLALVAPRVTIGKGIALGVILWLLMNLLVLPFLGWGVFGVAVTPKIALATLILHLVYGVTLGWLIDRDSDRATVYA